MTQVFAFTVTRANTPERAKLLLNTITEARKTAGMPFTWFMQGQMGTLGEGVMMNATAAGLLDPGGLIHEQNVGQHVAWNVALERAQKAEATYFLRLDDDVEFPTKQWLKKLVELSVAVDDKMIISPVVRGLQNPPRRSEPTPVRGFMLEFLLEAIGGICRLHPMALITNPTNPFIADVRKPMGGEDATGMGSWCMETITPMVYARHIRVKHAQTTEGQLNADPKHFANHSLYFHLPFIPAWKAPNNGGVHPGTVSME